jgi:hypothetical protein
VRHSVRNGLVILVVAFLACHPRPPAPPARSEHPRAIPSAAELARASRCERTVGDLRLGYAAWLHAIQQQRPAASSWSAVGLSHKVYDRAGVLEDLSIAWDAEVSVTIDLAVPSLDEAAREALTKAGAVVGTPIGASVLARIPVSRFECVSALELVQRIATDNEVIVPLAASASATRR